jgi:transcriptional regulator with XRE-family HTH domain
LPRTLRSLREKKGLTLRQVGDLVGVSYGSIQNYEAGDAVPPLDVAMRLAHLYGVTVEQIAAMVRRRKVAK